MSLFSDFVDRNTKDLQNLGGGKSSGGGSLISNPLAGISTKALQGVADSLSGINIPTPNLGQFNLSPNLDQDLTKIDVGSPNFQQLKPNTEQLKPNTEQDLSKISVRGLQESGVKQAGDFQNAAIKLGTDVQREVVNIGKAGQEALVQAGKVTQEAAVKFGKDTQEAAVKFGKDTQEAAVKFGTDVSGGQSNPTLESYSNQATKMMENVASTVTKGTELVIEQLLTKPAEYQVQQFTNYVEDKVMPVVNDAYKFATENHPTIKLGQEIVHEFENLTPSIELLGSMDLAPSSQVEDTSDPAELSDASNVGAPEFGDSQPFDDLEKATGKGSQMTEEERLRRLRRLLLNRYGREDTILTFGPSDTKSRRRYAL